MRIAFASEESKGLDSIVSRKFGRAAYFIIVDLVDDKVENIRAIENPGASAMGGAAIKAVQALINEKVDIVVAGAFGPNATVALQETGIKYYTYEGIKVEEVIKEIKKE